MQNNQINYHHDDNNEIQNILSPSPKNSKEDKIVHDLFYNNKNDYEIENNSENKHKSDNYNDINDNLIFSDNEGKNNTTNINLNTDNDNLKNNQINRINMEKNWKS